MDNGTIVMQLYARLGNRVLNLGNKEDKRVYDEKKGYLDAGGNVGQLADDVIRSATLYYPDNRIVQELYIAETGKLPELWLEEQKAAALGAGFPLNKLINEVVSRNCDANTVTKSQKYDQIVSIVD